MSPAGDAIRIDTKGAQPKLCSFLRKAQSYSLKHVVYAFRILRGRRFCFPAVHAFCKIFHYPDIEDRTEGRMQHQYLSVSAPPRT